MAALLATDSTARVLVLEFLGGARPTTQPWSVLYATALAQLHNTPVPAGRSVAVSTETELCAVLSRLENVADSVLLHGDPCPDNAVVTDDGIRFVDLEGAQRGPAVVELAYLRIGFPTCWCVKALPAQHVTTAENAYRDTRRSLANTQPVDDLTDACISWLVQGDALVERARRTR